MSSESPSSRSVSIFRGEDINKAIKYYEKLHDKGIYHHPKYLQVLSGNLEFDGERAEAFVIESDGEFVYYPFISRPLDTIQFDSTVPLHKYRDIIASWYYGGPLASSGATPQLLEKFVSEFESFCIDNNYVSEFIRFDPNIENYKDFFSLNPKFNRKTVWVDLNQSKEGIWDGYEGRNQRAIKQAQDSDLSVEATNNIEDIGDFHTVYSQRMEEMGVTEHYRFNKEFFYDILTEQLSDYFTLLVAREEEDIVGGFIIAHDAGVGHHYLSASLKDYWDDRINNLLYHNAVLEMHDKNANKFDFQGGREGVFKFKKGFSPHRGEFHISKCIHDGIPYQRLVDEANAAGISTNDGYFPQYRIERS
jgi:hypothetical protein